MKTKEEKTEAYEEISDLLLDTAMQKIAALYNISKEDYKLNTNYIVTDFLCNTIFYKLFSVIEEIAYFKFVLNTKHAYEKESHIYCSMKCKDCKKK